MIFSRLVSYSEGYYWVNFKELVHSFGQIIWLIYDFDECISGPGPSLMSALVWHFNLTR